MTIHQKYMVLKNYYKQKGFSATDAARFANNALLLIVAIPPHWSNDNDWQLYFAE